MAPDEDTANWAARAAEERTLVRRRFHDGFRWGGGPIAGTQKNVGKVLPNGRNKPNRGKVYRVAPLVYIGLRSEEHPLLRFFVSKLHRRAKLRTGREKGRVETGAPKVLALDAEYTEGNTIMRAILRVELDRDFHGGWIDLWAAIDGCGVVRPNLAIGHVNPSTGAVEHPHLIWILENSIPFTDRGSWRAQAAFRATLRSLIYALMPTGADPGGLSNSLRMKNPLSPLWGYAVGTPEPFASLDDVRSGLRWHVTDAMLWPEKAKAAGAAPDVDKVLAEPGSNSFFGSVRSFAFSRVADHHPLSGDSRSAGEFTAEVALFALELAEQFGRSERDARRVAESVAAWTWTHHNPDRASGDRWRSPNRGVLAAAVAGLAKPEAQAAGGRHVAAGRRATSAERLAAAEAALAAAGREPSRAALAAESGLSESTVSRLRRSRSVPVSDSVLIKRCGHSGVGSDGVGITPNHPDASVGSVAQAAAPALCRGDSGRSPTADQKIPTAADADPTGGCTGTEIAMADDDRLPHWAADLPVWDDPPRRVARWRQFDEQADARADDHLQRFRGLRPPGPEDTLADAAVPW